MPTLVRCEGFEHQTLDNAGTNAIWAALPTAGQTSIDTSIFRSGAASFEVAQGGVASANGRLQFQVDSAMRVVSFYFRIAAKPSNESTLARSISALATPDVQFRVLPSTGYLIAYYGASNYQTYSVDVCDGNWHRLDYRQDTSTTTLLTEWYVDGIQQTNVSIVGTAGAQTNLCLGSLTNAHTLTAWYDDVVVSNTSGDYPLGAHKVLSVVPTSDGTHVGAANCIEDQAGTDIVTPGYTTAYQLVDEWPANTDYIAQVAISGTSYAEVLFEDTTEATIWGVQGYLAYKSAGTPANDGDCQILDSADNILVHLLDGDMSWTTLRYEAVMVPAPGGGWTTTSFNGLKARVGFSADATPNPFWNALLLQYAVPEAVNATATPSTIAAVVAVPTAAESGAAGVTPTTVAAVAAVPTVTLAVTANPTVEPTPVATLAAVSEVVTSGGARAPPDTVAAAAAIPAPGVAGPVSATPTTVAAGAAIPAPTITAIQNPTASPDTIGATAGVSAPTPSGDANILPRVTNLVATMVSTTEIDLTWDAVTSAGGYDIERDGVVIVYDHPDEAYDDTGLDPATTYRYRVRAVP